MFREPTSSGMKSALSARHIQTKWLPGALRPAQSPSTNQEMLAVGGLSHTLLQYIHPFFGSAEEATDT